MTGQPDTSRQRILELFPENSGPGRVSSYAVLCAAADREDYFMDLTFSKEDLEAAAECVVRTQKNIPEFASAFEAAIHLIRRKEAEMEQLLAETVAEAWSVLEEEQL